MPGDVRIEVARTAVEDLRLNDLRKSLRDPTVIKEACQRVRKQLRSKQSAVSPSQLKKVEQEIVNLADAIASGIYRRAFPDRGGVVAERRDAGGVGGGRRNPRRSCACSG